jgi:hypothetical protein
MKKEHIELLENKLYVLKVSKKLSHLRNRLWRPIRLWDVKDPTLFRQSAHRWR